MAIPHLCYVTCCVRQPPMPAHRPVLHGHHPALSFLQASLPTFHPFLSSHSWDPLVGLSTFQVCPTRPSWGPGAPCVPSVVLFRKPCGFLGATLGQWTHWTWPWPKVNAQAGLTGQRLSPPDSGYRTDIAVTLGDPALRAPRCWFTELLAGTWNAPLVFHLCCC